MMVKLYQSGAYVLHGREIIADTEENRALIAQKGLCAQDDQGTIAYRILREHHKGASMRSLHITFDALASHDITYVGVVQTARASGLEKFPLPYVLTSCHNSLCAVGGTINEDDHVFGLSAAQKYGGVFVPSHLAVIHQYMREMYAGCGKMILGSDSHTRYGALGTMGVGEGGGELVKQLLQRTWDVEYPKVVGVHLTGRLRAGVGPQDVALALIGQVFHNGYVKNKIMEFFGDGVATLSMDSRCSIDIMTTETTCLSTIWMTDERVREQLRLYGREDAYRELKPADKAYYNGMIEVDLSQIEPMIALPMHPSNVYSLRALLSNPYDILRETEKKCDALLDTGKATVKLVDKIINGRVYIDQAVIAGCAGGTYENIAHAAEIIRRQGGGTAHCSLSLYPASQPVMLGLMKNGYAEMLLSAGAIMRTAFCGPCFGAGDIPANNGLSIRHTTRNFPNREGAKPGLGQMATVALMDARSIAATVANGGALLPADELDIKESLATYEFDPTPYQRRVYKGVGNPQPDGQLVMAPSIKDWPPLEPLKQHLLLAVVSFIEDPVTTTDELIPSGETASYRSDPMGLAEYTLCRKDPAYVGEAKRIKTLRDQACTGESSPELCGVLAQVRRIPGMEDVNIGAVTIGSTIFAVKPGDGSAREQAASCQRVLGACANIAREYATKRYRSNLINWGMIPFVLKDKPQFSKGAWIFVPNVAQGLLNHQTEMQAYLLGDDTQHITLTVQDLSDDEAQVIQKGGLINYYRDINKESAS